MRSLLARNTGVVADQSLYPPLSQGRGYNEAGAWHVGGALCESPPLSAHQGAGMHQVRVPICPCRTRVIPAVTVTSSIFYPSSYLVNFMLDSTVGLLLIYALLKAVACLVNRCNITPLRSGEYGACDHVCSVFGV